MTRRRWSLVFVRRCARLDLSFLHHRFFFPCYCCFLFFVFPFLFLLLVSFSPSTLSCPSFLPSSFPPFLPPPLSSSSDFHYFFQHLSLPPVLLLPLLPFFRISFCSLPTSFSFVFQVPPFPHFLFPLPFFLRSPFPPPLLLPLLSSIFFSFLSSLLSSFFPSLIYSTPLPLPLHFHFFPPPSFLPPFLLFTLLYILLFLLLLSHLHPRLTQVGPLRQLLPDEGIRVVGLLKHPLERRQLHRSKGGPVASRLLLAALCVLVCWGRRGGLGGAVADWVRALTFEPN